MNVCHCDAIPVAIQGIPLKRVCRCIVHLFFLDPAVAIHGFSLENVCRCMDVCLCDVIPVAIQGIPLKRVCRCTTYCIWPLI